MTSHGEFYTHWVLTACGLDIDGSCEKHLAEGQPCRGYGLAWTRSRDLESYQRRPYEDWPPPCPVCSRVGGERPVRASSDESQQPRDDPATPDGPG